MRTSRKNKTISLRKLKRAAMRSQSKRNCVTRPRLRGSYSASIRQGRSKENSPVKRGCIPWKKQTLEMRFRRSRSHLRLRSWSVRRSRTLFLRKSSLSKTKMKPERSWERRSWIYLELLKMRSWPNRKKPVLRFSQWLLSARKRPNTEKSKKPTTKRTLAQKRQRSRRRWIWTLQPNTYRGMELVLDRRKVLGQKEKGQEGWRQEKKRKKVRENNIRKKVYHFIINR